MNKGFHYWNWGGTWQSQEGVYSFKNRWNVNGIKTKQSKSAEDDYINTYDAIVNGPKWASLRSRDPPWGPGGLTWIPENPNLGIMLYNR